jgi:hypothetical protein
MSVSGKNILNNAATPNGGSQSNLGDFNNYGAATGSVQIPGVYTTIQFRVWLRGSNSSQFGWSSAGVGVVTGATHPPLTGDVWMISASFEKQQIITLPSTGVTLSGTLNGNNVSLNWKTLTEVNSKSFEIERSTDGINFVKVGEKAAAGYSVSDINYSHIDPNMTASIYYYRLKMVDLDNRFTYSNLAIVRKGTKSAITVFPNPVTDYTNVEFSNAKGTYNISVINQAGQVLQVRNAEITSTVQYVRIEKGNLPTGMYHLRIVNTESGDVQTQKLIVK